VDDQDSQRLPCHNPTSYLAAGDRRRSWRAGAPNGCEISRPAEAGNDTLTLGEAAGNTSIHRSPARHVSFSELSGIRGFNPL
jgi:hypothetical protein